MGTLDDALAAAGPGSPQTQNQGTLSAALAAAQDQTTGEEGPRTFKNQPFVGGTAHLPAGSTVEPVAPAAWRQYLERQASHSEEGGLVGTAARNIAEPVALAALNAPSGMLSSAGGFVSGLGSLEQFDSPTLQNVGSVLSRIGAAITPGDWAKPKTAVSQLGAAGADLAGQGLALAGSGYQQMAELAGAPRLGAVAGNVVSHLPLVAGAVEAAGSGIGALRSAISKAPISSSAQGVTAVGGTSLRTTPLPTVDQLTPETQAAIQVAQSKGLPINPDVVARHAEAESLPIPIKLSDGQANAGVTPGGLDKLSNEWNMRAKNGMADMFNGQNGLLIDNFKAIKENAAPAVTATTRAETGQGLIDSYQRLDAPKTAAIEQAYQAVQDANKGLPPIDAQQLLQNTQAALRQKLLSRQDPGGQMSELTDLARRGGMTMEDFLNMRRNLGDVARTSSDPGARTAASTMIDQLENMPLIDGASQNVRNLATTARSLARQRFDALRADPAYNAAVNGTVVPDDFVQRFVVNGKDADVTAMRQNLDSLGQQHMAAGAMDYLTQRAGVLNGTGNVSQAGLNRALYGQNGLSSKLNSVFDPKTAQDIESLANTARYTQQQPRGSYINNSNTFVAAAAHGLGEAAAQALGIPPGAVTFGREMLQKKMQQRAGQKAMAPGAGITGP